MINILEGNGVELTQGENFYLRVRPTNTIFKDGDKFKVIVHKGKVILFEKKIETIEEDGTFIIDFDSKDTINLCGEYEMSIKGYLNNGFNTYLLNSASFIIKEGIINDYY